MKNMKLLIRGDANIGDCILENVIHYTVASPYTDRNKIMGTFVRTDSLNSIIEDFYAHWGVRIKEWPFKVFHFIIFAKPPKNMDDVLELGAQALADWFLSHKFQSVLLPHYEGVRANFIGTHWHIIVNPVSLQSEMCIHDEHVFY